MVRLRGALAAAALLTALSAQAHLIVDVKMSIRAPAFVAAGQPFTYEVVADDLANDNAVGLVVTDTLPSGVAFVSATAADWNCSTSKGTVTCSAEQITPGEHVIAIRVNAPSQPSTLLNKVHVTSLGSFDPQPNNDDAVSSTTIYDPSRCTAPPPALLSPADGALVDASVVHFEWAASAAGARYVVHAATEGAAEGAVATTTSSSASAVLDRGTSAWRVETVFTDCPSVTSAPRRVTTTRAPAVSINDVATALTSPAGVAFGPGGELYITDENDSVVRLFADGQLTTIAGAVGERGTANGQFARFDHPRGVTVTPLDGFVFVADSGNHEVRVLYTGGPFVPAWDAAGVAATPGFKDGQSSVALLNAPSAVAATLRGSIYVADTGNHAVRLLTPVSGFVGLFAVTTVAHFDSPEGVAVDASGALYIADGSTHTISKIVNGTLTTVASAGLDHPSALALDALGNLYVCDRGSNALLKIAPSGLVTTVAQFGDPTGVAVAADGSVYVADAGAHAVRRVKVIAAAPPPITRRRATGH